MNTADPHFVFSLVFARRSFFPVVGFVRLLYINAKINGIAVCKRLVLQSIGIEADCTAADLIRLISENFDSIFYVVADRSAVQYAAAYEIDDSPVNDRLLNILYTAAVYGKFQRLHHIVLCAVKLHRAKHVAHIFVTALFLHRIGAVIIELAVVGGEAISVNPSITLVVPVAAFRLIAENCCALAFLST